MSIHYSNTKPLQVVINNDSKTDLSRHQSSAIQTSTQNIANNNGIETAQVETQKIKEVKHNSPIKEINNSSNRENSQNSEDTYIPFEKDSDVESSAIPKFRLTVLPFPEYAQIKILNIKPKYYDGIDIQTNKALIEVSAKGYITKKSWFKIEDHEKIRVILNLREIPNWDLKI